MAEEQVAEEAGDGAAGNVQMYPDAVNPNPDESVETLTAISSTDVHVACESKKLVMHATASCAATYGEACGVIDFTISSPRARIPGRVFSVSSSAIQ